MSVDLGHWLTEQRNLVLPRWISTSLPPLVASSAPQPQDGQAVVGHGGDPYGDGVVISGGNETTRATGATEATETVEIFAHLYEGLVQAAYGDLGLLDEHLGSLLPIRQGSKLHDLLAMTGHLRRVAWDILQNDSANPARTFALMRELERLLEYTGESITRSWEQKAEAEIRERISQAEFIAESMAAAIEQADRTALQLSSLNDASHRLASSLEDPQQVVEQVGETLLELMRPAHIAIWLPDAPLCQQATGVDGRQCDLYAACSWGEERKPVTNMRLDGSNPHDIVIRAYSHTTFMFQPRPTGAIQGDWYQPGCGVIALPLLVKEQAIGVVVMQDPVPEERFSRSQQNLALAVVNQGAIALENARLYARIRNFNAELEQLVEERTGELQAEKERLATIHEISKEISSTLDLDMLLQTSLETLARITNVEYGSIMLVEAETGNLVNRSVLGQKSVNTFTRFPVGMGVAGWVAHHRQPALIPDVSRDERWVPLPTDEVTPGKKHKGSMLAVPLVAHNEILGVLILSHSKPGYFHEGHLRLLTASAGAIAIGINNANMYTTIFEEMERNSVLLQRQSMETSKMEAILQSLSDGVLVCDTYGEILSANPAAGRILQRDITELLFTGTTLQSILDSLLVQHQGKLSLDDLLAMPLGSSGEPRVLESTVKVGVRVISLSLGPVLKEDGELIGALLLMHDVSREVESDRLKTEFIGTMSHELRTPMTAIKGFTQLLAMGGLGPVNDTQREFLQTIQNNSERMISIINDVLDITKIETGSIDLELRPIHLAESLSGVVSDLQNAIKTRSHTLTIDIPTGLPLVWADASRLHQILYNLLSNAVKYTPAGGQITVQAHEAVYDRLPESVRSKIVKKKRYVQMDIRDTGVGIADHEFDLVFERFYRTENPLKIEAGGTGLGLSLVKSLVELLGGVIWIESVLNQGSTFRFILPCPSDG
ncbi:MAG: GAF domain-containing protein [Chloroflexaceae bacterium]|nr:GAF domain-containing protein [Chloroflexaceae bacterium]